MITVEPLAKTTFRVTRLKKGNTKLDIKNKRLKAGWGECHLARLLFESPDSAQKTTPSDSPNVAVKVPSVGCGSGQSHQGTLIYGASNILRFNRLSLPCIENRFCQTGILPDSP